MKMRHLFPVYIFLLASLQLVGQTERNLEPLYIGDSSEKRTALVIGNSDYAEAPLSNPVNDAGDIAAALKALGFEAQLLINARRGDMIEAIRSFGDRLRRNGGIGLFFFAGHGIQVDGRNYLVPVDADIRKEHEVEDEGVNVGRLLGEMELARNRLNIVILDACRNNPYERSFRSGGHGLASIDAPRGTLIAYATAPGSVAADGSGRNSPYTAALLQYIPQENEPVERVFKKVRATVISQTNGAQIPWESSSLIGEFYFAATAHPANLSSGAANPAAQPTTDEKVSPLTYDPKMSVPGNTAIISQQRKLRSQPAFVDQNELQSLAQQVGLNLKRVGNNVDPNVVDFAVSGDGWEQAFRFESNGKVVHDRNSGLMWEHSGSQPEKNMLGLIEWLGIDYPAAQQYVTGLNTQKFAGYDNWRLPTVAEALTLMESPAYKKQNVLRVNIDYFDATQTSIWTADGFAGERHWVIDFDAGLCSAVPDRYKIPVRAVRSVDGSRVSESDGNNAGEDNSPTRTTAQPVDISGLWYDAEGTAYRLENNGRFFTFTSLNLLSGFVAEGTATLSGNNFSCNYTSNLVSTGSISGTVAGDGQRIDVTVTDTVMGTFRMTMTRQP